MFYAITLAVLTLLVFVQPVACRVVTTATNSTCGNRFSCYLNNGTASNITELVLGPFDHTAVPVAYNLTNNIEIRSDSHQQIRCSGGANIVLRGNAAHSVTLTNIRFSGCSITLDDPVDVLIRNCTFDDLTSGTHSALEIYSGATVVIHNTNFHNNEIQARQGAALKVVLATTLSLKDANFLRNKLVNSPQPAEGGAVSLSSITEVNITGCYFQDDGIQIRSDVNVGLRGGAMYLSRINAVDVIDTVFQENFVFRTPTAANSTYRIGGDGCAVAMGDGVLLPRFDNVIFSDNCPGFYNEQPRGSAIYADQPTRVITLSNVAFQKANEKRGEIFCAADTVAVKVEKNVVSCAQNITNHCKIDDTTNNPATLCKNCTESLCCIDDDLTPFIPGHDKCRDDGYQSPVISITNAPTLPSVPIGDLARHCTNCSCLMCPASMTSTKNHIDVLISDNNTMVANDSMISTTGDDSYYFVGCFQDVATGAFRVDVTQVDPHVYKTLPNIALLCGNVTVQFENNHKCHATNHSTTDNVLRVRFYENGKCKNSFPVAIVATMASLIVLVAFIAALMCIVPTVRKAVRQGSEVTAQHGRPNSHTNK